MTMLLVAEQDAETTGRRIGLRVSSERARLSWSQKQLAYKSGVNRDTIASLETGKTGAPGAETLYRLARALGVPLEYLITGQMPEDTLPPERANFARRIAANLSLDDLSWAEQTLARLFLRGPQREAQQPAEQEAPNEGTGDAPHAQSGGR